MSDTPVTEIRPHERALHVVVQRRSLDPISAQQLFDNVQLAASERPDVPIVLDMNQVRFAPSVALGALVTLSKALRLEGRRIVLVGVQDRVYDAILVTRLQQILEMFPTIEAAVK